MAIEAQLADSRTSGASHQEGQLQKITDARQEGRLRHLVDFNQNSAGLVRSDKVGGNLDARGEDDRGRAARLQRVVTRSKRIDNGGVARGLKRKCPDRGKSGGQDGRIGLAPIVVGADGLYISIGRGGENRDARIADEILARYAKFT